MVKKIKFDGFLEGRSKELNREAKVILELLQKHYDVELSDEPDYIFCNVNSDTYFQYDGIRIFCTIEAICPDFNLCDYGIGFEYLDFGDRYFRFPNYVLYYDQTAKMVDKHKHVTPQMAQREFCSFVYSNANAAPKRGELFHVLSKYKKVDAGGMYLNNMPNGERVVDKNAFETEHKFSIACENASYPGYHTEKMVEAFAAGTVPIYWGDPRIKEVFNPKAFIYADDFSSEDNLLQEIRRLDQDDEAYLGMLREPALLINDLNGEEYVSKCLEGLENYLLHILEQPLDMAYRRNRGFWGEQYLDKKRCESKIISKYLNLRNGKAGSLLRKLLRK